MRLAVSSAMRVDSEAPLTVAVPVHDDELVGITPPAILKV